MRSRLALLPLLLLCVVAAAPPVASAPADLHIVDARASVVFPLSLEFTIEAESSSPIVDARLLYQVDKMNYAPVTSEAWPVVVPSTTLATSWTWDMRRASLPPGATITYWWRLRDRSGAVVESDPHMLTFDDNRHSWQETGSSTVSLRWYEGDEAFAAQMIDVCDTAVEDLARDVGTRVDRQIKVYIYASSEDMRQAMVYPQEWTGGVAFTDYGIVAIGIGPGDMDWGVRALRHELLPAAARLAGAVAAAEELDVVGHDLDRLALGAVLGVPLAPGQLALDADGAALGEVLGAVLGGPAPHRDVEVVRGVLPLLAALDAVVDGDAERRHRGSGRRVPQLRVARQVADEDDAVDALGHYSSSSELSIGSATSSRAGPPAATGWVEPGL